MCAIIAKMINAGHELSPTPMEKTLPQEVLIQKSEEYLIMEAQYAQAVGSFRTASAREERNAYAESMRELNVRMQHLRNEYGLIIGGFHGQEISNAVVLYDPAIHQVAQLHGEIQSGDPIRFLNTAICSSNGDVLVPAQAIRVY